MQRSIAITFATFAVLGLNCSALAAPIVISSMSGFENIQNDLTGSYILGSSINASGFAFAPITGLFSGTFDGGGYSINNLTYNNPSASFGALFLAVGSTGTIQNLSLNNASITASPIGEAAGITTFNLGTIKNVTVNGSFNAGSIGGIASYTEGTILNSQAKILGTITGGNGGGITADNRGTITDSSSSGSLKQTGTGCPNCASAMGGIAGHSSGTITNSHSSVNIFGIESVAGGLVGVTSNGHTSQSYATGNISATGARNTIGGFAGISNPGSTISNSYSTGSVKITQVADPFMIDHAGGFVGNLQGGTIAHSYSTGSVQSTGLPGSYHAVGGFVASAVNFYPNALISTSYWDKQASGIQIASGDVLVPGAAGLDTGTFKSGTLPSALSSSIWKASAGLYPTLKTASKTAIKTAAPATSHDLSFPLVTSNKVYLNVEAGGQAFDGVDDPNHLPTTAYYSLDFDTPGQTSTVVAARDGYIVRIAYDADFSPNHLNKTAVTIYHPSLSNPANNVFIFSEYGEFTLSPELQQKLLDKCPGAAACTFQMSDNLTVNNNEALGTLRGISNEHLHFQVKQSSSISIHGTGLSKEGNGILPTITVGGRLFKDFVLTYPNGTPLPEGASMQQGTQIYGPNITALPSTAGGKFIFNVVAGNLGVGVTTPIFVDPLFAIGYDFEIQSGPLFTSVVLAPAGDNLFELYLWDQVLNDWSFEANVFAGDPYFFISGGVDRFRILGIEESANLDPSDPTAFVTGLTFEDTGEVSFTQTPLVADIPEPEMVAIFFSGVIATALMRRRRRPLENNPGGR